MTVQPGRVRAIGLLAVAGSGVTLTGAFVPWISGCLGREADGPPPGCPPPRGGLALIGWWMLIPFAAGLIALVLGIYLASTPRAFRPAHRQALRMPGGITFAFAVLAFLMHWWTAETRGGEPAGWNYAAGLAVLASGGVLIWFSSWLFWLFSEPITSPSASRTEG